MHEKKRRCLKYQPKKFHEEINFTNNGFTQYQCQESKMYVRLYNHNLDNRRLVPQHNPA